MLALRNHHEQVTKAFSHQKLCWPFTIWINCSSDLKIFENSRPSASNFKSFSRSLEQFFLTVGQNNFCNKIPFPNKVCRFKVLDVQTLLKPALSLDEIVVWFLYLQFHFPYLFWRETPWQNVSKSSVEDLTDFDSQFLWEVCQMPRLRVRK